MKGRQINMAMDMAKRSEDARRAHMRADAVLNKRLHETGGIEDMKRLHFQNIKREQLHLKQELQNIQHKRRIRGSSNGESSDESDVDSSPGDVPSFGGTDYGKNYFGYKSSPGSNRGRLDQIKTKDNGKNNYGSYNANVPSRASREVKKKLREERNHYEAIQSKAKDFSSKIWGRKMSKGSGSSGNPSLSEINFKQAKDAVTNRLAQPSTETPAVRNQSPPLRPVKVARKKSIVIPSSQFPSFTQLPKTLFSSGGVSVDYEDEVVSTVSKKADQQSNSTLVSGSACPKTTPKVKTALDLVFDDEIYAPDGRVRMVHRLPDFKTSFLEAKMARYIRTRERRDIEKELSVDNMFSSIKTSRSSNTDNVFTA